MQSDIHLVWDSNFCIEDEKHGYIKTKESIRRLPPWKFKEERTILIKSQFGIFKNAARAALQLFDDIALERDDIVETNIFVVFPYYPPKEKPYYCTGRYV